MKVTQEPRLPGFTPQLPIRLTDLLREFARAINSLSDASGSGAGGFSSIAEAQAAFIDASAGGVYVNGYVSALDGGGAWYGRVASEPSHTGKFQSADGAWWELSPAQDIFPEMFGCPAQGSSSDMSPYIQKVADYWVTIGCSGGIHLQQGKTYNCLTKVTVDPTRHSIEGRMATLSFANKYIANYGSNIVTDPSLDNSASWTLNTPGSNPLAWVISGGVATHGNVSDGYGEFGQYVPVVAGKKYLVQVSVDSLTASTTQKYLSWSIRQYGVGNGSSGGTLNSLQKTVSTPEVWEFEITSPYNGGWMTLQSSNGCVVSNIVLKEIPDVECLVIEAASTSPQFGHVRHSIRQLRLLGADGGANDANKLSVGITLRTQTALLSTRLAMYSVDVQGFGVGEKGMTRSYLVQHYSCRFRNTIGVWWAGGDDAGENMYYDGCTIGGGDIALKITAAVSMNFSGTSWDYAKQWLYMDGGGVVTFSGGHVEMSRPTTSTMYPFHIIKGTLVMHGGDGLISGTNFALGPAHDYTFMLETKYAHVIIRDFDVYNWRSLSGCLAGGEGTIQTSFRGSSQKELPYLLKDDDRHDLLGGAGGFEAGALDKLNCWAEGPTITSRLVTSSCQATLDTSSGNARTGSGRLVLEKLSTSSNAKFNVLIPFPQGKMYGSRHYYKCYVPGGNSGTVKVFVDIYFVNWQGMKDTNGNPVLGFKEFRSSAGYSVDLSTGITSWTEGSINSAGYDDSLADGWCPHGATHMLVTWNLYALPIGAKWYVDDWRVAAM